MTTRATALPRRLFLARTLAVTAGAVALGTAGTGTYIANSAPVVRRIPITLPRLDPALDGLRIVTFSDAHLSATYGGRRFERLVEIVNAQRPDVVAITGDLVDGSVERAARGRRPAAPTCAARTASSSSPATTSTTRAPTRGSRTCARSASRVLRNERVAIGSGRVVRPRRRRRLGARASAAATAPTSQRGARGPRPRRARSCCSRTSRAPSTRRAAPASDLQLSGHTHGGQLWPVDFVVRLAAAVRRGAHRHGATQLYVTRGTGYWGPPMRVGAPAGGDRGGAAGPAVTPPVREGCSASNVSSMTSSMSRSPLLSAYRGCRRERAHVGVHHDRVRRPHAGPGSLRAYRRHPPPGARS